MVNKIDYSKNIDLAYIKGVVVGDGWATYSDGAKRYEIGLTSNDKCFIDKFVNALISIGLKPWKGFRTDKKQWRCSVNSKKLKEWLDSFSISWFTNTPEIIAFLTGFYESDGLSSQEPSYCKTDLNLLNQSQKYLERLGIKSSIQGPYGKNRGDKKLKPYYFLYILAESRDLFKSLIVPVNKFNLVEVKE